MKIEIERFTYVVLEPHPDKVGVMVECAGFNDEQEAEWYVDEIEKSEGYVPWVVKWTGTKYERIN